MTIAPFKFYDEAMGEVFAQDQALATQVLNDCLAEGDREGFLIALRQVAKAHGGLAKIAQQTGLNEQTLYRTLSRQGNPELNTLLQVTEAVGLRMEVVSA